MKKILLGMIVLASVASCKSSSDKGGCESTVAGIAATFKITKAVLSATGIPDQDVTTTYLTDCERNGVYVLKSDKTATYTESGTCSDSGTGTWDVVDNKITLDAGGGSITYTATPLSSWDCGTLVVAEDLGGATLKTFFTKQ